MKTNEQITLIPIVVSGLRLTARAACFACRAPAKAGDFVFTRHAP